MTSLTQEQKTEIERLYKLKILNKNISTIMGLSKHVVNNYIYKDYLKTNERAKNTAEHLKLADEVIDMYKNGITYKAIAERRSVRKLYVETLVKRGDITLEEAEQALAKSEETAKKSEKFAIEVRQGERTRCRSYCQVSPFCTQYQNYLKEIL